MQKEKSCGAIIYRKGNSDIRYLLVQAVEGHWDFVKGHVEEGESEEDTARREAREETGIIDLWLVPGFKERIAYMFQKDGQRIFKEVIIFLAETKTEEVILSDENPAFVWLNYSDALGKITYENSKKILANANSTLMGICKT